jgi:hypothetical protein
MDHWTLRGSSNVVDRGEHRSLQVLLAAEVADGSSKEPARIVEVSARGVRVYVSEIFQVRQKVVVRRGEAVIPGSVVWRSGRFAEIAFDSEIDERASETSGIVAPLAISLFSSMYRLLTSEAGKAPEHPAAISPLASNTR